MRNINFKQSLYEFINDDKIAIKTIRDLEKYYEIIIFGGAVRDYLFSDVQFSPRDIDIVLSPKKEYICIDKVLRNNYGDENLYKNRFGGYKLKNKFIQFDIWYLKDTWAFKEKILDTNINNLLSSVFLNIDAYAYNLTTELFIDNCNENIDIEEIDIVLDENPSVELNLLRAMVYYEKYNLDISNTIRNKFRKYFKQEYKFINQLYKLQLQHYKEQIFDKNILKSKINYLINN
ncbi:hypothetical protein SH1V18_38750 [Vallitalea longa]|uniref:Poly A polymerase head domain-containing protein n=1 Tax=Vallitalea longa TaxID=2936439 RepID=A0A9W6DG96_9FIRM|nr:hypothetical protein [Vallitalea longa]GKX31395.1 hypothetical protein SH1V18_38750 [Vallitalea longa]